MKLRQRKKFIRELMENIHAEMQAKAAQMPDEWDGLEIRELIAAKFHDACLMSRRPRDFRKRLSDYRSEVYTRNL